MIDDIPSLRTLIKRLQQVPYLATKNLYRVVTYFLSADDEKIQQFCKAVLEAKANIVACPTCCSWREKNKPCSFCDSPKRDRSVICVVETWQEQMSIEKTGAFDGLYHVLGGAICPLDGIGPEELSIDQLVNRVDDSVKELILATNQTPEGEATAAYIAKRLSERSGLNISCLARGVPVGSSLEYMDRVTVYKALSERRPF